MARKEVPDRVKKYYPGANLHFGSDYVIPKPFDRRLFVEVSFAVAEAAINSGVAPVTDLKAYRAGLDQRNERRIAVDD